MPFAFSRPEFLTSRRHLTAGGVGLVVILALCGAATFAPGPGIAAPVAAAAPAASSADVVDAPTGRDGLPTAVATATRPAAGRAAPSASPTPNGPAITALAAQGIPIVALDAYEKAAAIQADRDPACHLGWPLVAAIGAVESGHGTHAGARLYADGQDLPHVIGPVLDGTAGNAKILDTDKGVLDGDKVYDRAVGPMQFIPSTWRAHAVDANGDGKADPFNIFDAAATTGAYLCQGGEDLGTDAGRKVAVFAYNHLDSYVATVLGLEAVYAGRPVTTTSPSPAAPPATPTPSTPVSRAPTAPRPAPTTTAPKPAPTSPTCPTPSPSGSPTTSATPGPSPTGCPTTTPPAAPTPTASGASPSPSAALASATPTPPG